MRFLKMAAVAGAFALGAGAVVAGGVTHPAGAQAVTPAENAQVRAVPRYDHVVVALFENKNYPDIASGSKAPYFQSLAGQGALFTQSFGVTHPSQPNYIALFSGSQQGVTGDSCPNSFGTKGNLGQQLLDANLTFKGYSEGLPSTGYTGCGSGRYARKHAPWTNFSNVPAALQVPFSQFPTDYGKLPTVSFVVPDMCDDMHDCSIGTGDSWTKSHLDSYAQWAKSHNSLLITSFDEDNFTSVNQIYTSFVGQGVTAGKYAEKVDHYRILRTLENMYGLPALGQAASREPLTDIWG
ncbi:alkaline phosphatase family protein [Amycolatopsis sp. H20-H5]|uniref:alkaline phosphatase family protein n=1 Tax=Amycolatopsis sp. H20-H5 TaxID=3046309 RepID=UPI002DB87BDC|nr:alkaline phosphatase family protein [Amycolatopsis sp. H20-H5]MEC3977562.1 alkaline phosphatase family protein [Amycolatopsis sp. H20-H5]